MKLVQLVAKRLRSLPPLQQMKTFFFFLFLACNVEFFARRFGAEAGSNQTSYESLLSGGSGAKSQFYIYEWPSYIDDVWPPPQSPLHAKSGYDHGFYANRGAGDAISPDVGLFQTWQFSLYKNLMARLRTSEFRTRDPAKAVAFIVPFDLGDLHHYWRQTSHWKPNLLMSSSHCCWWCPVLTKMFSYC